MDSYYHQFKNKTIKTINNHQYILIYFVLIFMDVLLNSSNNYRALTDNLPFIILCRKIVNARYPTTITSPLPPPFITLKMMVKNQNKGILKNNTCHWSIMNSWAFVRLLMNSRVKGLQSFFNSQTQPHEFIIDQRHIISSY